MIWWKKGMGEEWARLKWELDSLSVVISSTLLHTLFCCRVTHLDVKKKKRLELKHSTRQPFHSLFNIVQAEINFRHINGHLQNKGKYFISNTNDLFTWTLISVYMHIMMSSKANMSTLKVVFKSISCETFKRWRLFVFMLRLCGCLRLKWCTVLMNEMIHRKQTLKSTSNTSRVWAVIISIIANLV